MGPNFTLPGYINLSHPSPEKLLSLLSSSECRAWTQASEVLTEAGLLLNNSIIILTLLLLVFGSAGNFWKPFRPSMAIASFYHGLALAARPWRRVCCYCVFRAVRMWCGMQLRSYCCGVLLCCRVGILVTACLCNVYLVLQDASISIARLASYCRDLRLFWSSVVLWSCGLRLPP